jgi:hypothetical protein
MEGVDNAKHCLLFSRSTLTGKDTSSTAGELYTYMDIIISMYG